jgi:toxin FitB
MIVLDTNVVSEMMKPERHPNVRAWMRAQAVHELATTTVTLAEIGYGLARLPEGRRRFELETNLQAFVVRGLGPRVFSFDRAAAQVYGEMIVARERTGRPFEGFDGLIAAIAKTRDAAIATRNVADFANCGMSIVNPWDDPGSSNP